MSGLFKAIEGSAVVLYNRGVYKQVDVSVRKGELYAKWSSGFIRLMNSSYTSYGDVKWSDLELPETVVLVPARTGGVKIKTVD